MKEEWKVFIRGVEGRGSEVIKMLTDLGAENTWHSCGSDPGCIYFIRHDGTVGDAAYNSELALMVKEYCHEVKLPEKWQDGDVLVNVEFDDCFAVCKCKSPCNTRYNAYHCYMYADFRCGEIDAKGCDILHSAYRLATPSEVEHFHELLRKHGKEWDAEKKQLVDWRWKPIIDKPYWMVTSIGEVTEFQWHNSRIDNLFFNFGNCFKTKEEAEDMCEEIKRLLNAKL